MIGLPPLFADECIRREIVDHLRARGADVVSIVDIAPSAKDPTVLAESVLRQRILLTADYDFGELHFRDGKSALGVVVIALNRLRTTLHGPIVEVALIKHRLELIGGFLVIEPGRTRLRRLDDPSK